LEGSYFLQNHLLSSWIGQSILYLNLDDWTMYSSLSITVLLLIAVINYGTSSPVLIATNGPNDPDGPIQSNDRISLRGLIDETIGDIVVGEHIFFILPPRNRDLDGVTALAPKLSSVKGKVAEIKSFVHGGVDSSKLTDLVGRKNVKEVRGLENFKEELVEAGKVLVVQLDGNEDPKSVDKVVSKAMGASKDVPRKVYLASQSTNAEQAERREERR